MGTELTGTVNSLAPDFEGETRQERAVGLAKDLSVIWILACVLLCSACGHLLFSYWAFHSYALSDGRSAPARLVVFCVGQ